MSYKQLMKPGGILTAILLGVGLSPTAFGATAADTEVTNTADVDYDVNGNAQTTVNSNTESFFVDIAVDFLIQTNDGAPVQVALGATEYTAFTLTNNGNDALFFVVSASDVDSETAFDGGTDETGNTGDPAMGNFVIYEDAGTIGTFEGGTDTDITGTAVEVAGNGGTLNILVAADAPTSGTDGDIAVIQANATVTDSDGSAVADGAQANGLTNPAWGGYDNSVQLAFVEDVGNAGGVNGDEDDTGDNDGQVEDTSAYEIQAADIQVTKSNSVIDDTLGGTAYHVPGATIEYTIVIENLGSAAAEDINLSDTLSGDVTYLDDDSAYTGGDIRIRDYGTGEDGGVAGACDGALGTTNVYDEDDDGGDTGTDGVVFSGGTVSTTDTLALDIPADSCVDISFQVTIN